MPSPGGEGGSARSPARDETDEVFPLLLARCRSEQFSFHLIRPSLRTGAPSPQGEGFVSRTLVYYIYVKIKKKPLPGREEAKAIHMIFTTKRGFAVDRRRHAALPDGGLDRFQSILTVVARPTSGYPSRRRPARKLVMLSGLRCRSHRWDAAHLQYP